MWIQNANERLSRSRSLYLYVTLAFECVKANEFCARQSTDFNPKHGALSLKLQNFLLIAIPHSSSVSQDIFLGNTKITREYEIRNGGRPAVREVWAGQKFAEPNSR